MNWIGFSLWMHICISLLLFSLVALEVKRKKRNYKLIVWLSLLLFCFCWEITYIFMISDGIRKRMIK
jgi:phosphoglycerol transferase MdoB-like AlkP superfamily enzyme